MFPGGSENERLITLKAHFDAIFDREPEDAQNRSAVVRGIKIHERGQLSTYTQCKKVLSALAPRFMFCSKGIHYYPRELAGHPDIFEKIFPFPCTFDKDEAW